MNPQSPSTRARAEPCEPDTSFNLSRVDCCTTLPPEIASNSVACSHFVLSQRFLVWFVGSSAWEGRGSSWSASPTTPSSHSPAAWMFSPSGWLPATATYGLTTRLMATIGAVVGGYITYALGRKGGKEAIERKLKKDKAQKTLETL